jgi:hypothetical protein
VTRSTQYMVNRQLQAQVNVQHQVLPRWTGTFSSYVFSLLGMLTSHTPLSLHTTLAPADNNHTPRNTLLEVPAKLPRSQQILALPAIRTPHSHAASVVLLMHTATGRQVGRCPLWLQRLASAPTPVCCAVLCCAVLSHYRSGWAVAADRWPSSLVACVQPAVLTRQGPAARAPFVAAANGCVLVGCSAPAAVMAGCGKVGGHTAELAAAPAAAALVG